MLDPLICSNTIIKLLYMVNRKIRFVILEKYREVLTNGNSLVYLEDFNVSLAHVRLMETSCYFSSRFFRLHLDIAVSSGSVLGGQHINTTMI